MLKYNKIYSFLEIIVESNIWYLLPPFLLVF